MTIEEMKQKKKEYGYTYQQISRLSGVPLGTIQKIFCGETKAPRRETILALEKLFDPVTSRYSNPELWQSTPERLPSNPARLQPNLVCDAPAPYGWKQQGEYTVEDYYALPEDYRAELIDGIIYDMAAPKSTHQAVSGEIFHQLRTFIKNKKGSCVPFTAPIAVQLDCDNKTLLEPDVVVLCDRSKLLERCIYGAPDFVIEILSPSNRKKDMILKLNKYMNAGVREYWMVDPDNRRILVYDFATDNYPVIYGFDSEVPIGIWNGKYKIDFGEISAYMAELYPGKWG